MPACLSNVKQFLKLVSWSIDSEHLNILDVNLYMPHSVHKHILKTLVLPIGLPSITENTVFKRCFWRCPPGPISDTCLWVMKIDKDNSLHLKSLLSQFIIPVTEPLEVCDSSQLLEQNCGPDVSPKWRMEVPWILSRALHRSL